MRHTFAMEGLQLYFNPACSKCRRALELLDERGASYHARNYLEEPLDRGELEALAARVEGGARALLRAKDVDSARLEGASDEDILAWIAESPALLERPIAQRGERVLIARPPELLEQLL